MELEVNETVNAEWGSCMVFEGNIKTDYEGRAFIVNHSVVDLNRILSEKLGQLTKVAIYYK